ncbi:hypothetical protein IQ31_02306 [Sphingobacterium siyangense]|uniref:Uncharacterized protein n=1 Tax=Sphingobacterium siyangense TaxID=459529 RepID=A0A562MLB0_9SPHI|nr:hypothetical protein IQ31_02306 [Sphingobacterium siyangense]
MYYSKRGMNNPVEINSILKDNKISNILEIIIIAHAFHLLLSICLLTIIFIKVFKLQDSVNFYIYFVDGNKKNFFDRVLKFWEYLTILWTAFYISIIYSSI